MYLEHLQLKSQPFAEHAAVAALWQDQRMDEGLARLEYLVQNGQLGLITGPSGVGKSALLKRFLHGLLPQHCQALYCHLSHLPPAGLLKLIVTQLGETPRRGKERIYEQILERASRAEGALLLVFDEAHLLDGDALTDLRLLISSALDVRPPLKLLLVGQEPLRGVLRRAQHADLVNRISVRYQLRPLTREQSCRYIDFQITQAGGDSKLFDDSVKAAIHDFANGVPRQINNLATACLLQATARKVRRIDDALFQQAVGEFQLPEDQENTMPRYFPDELLRRLRNDISWASLLKQLEWPHKLREEQLAFLCPRCHECHSAVNPRTNLGRCFRCEINFNPIDLTMAVRQCDFVSAVHYLEPFLLHGTRQSVSR